MSQFVRRLGVTPLLVFFVTASRTSSPAEMQGQPVGQDSGPLRELSTNVGAGAGPVSETGGSLRGLNAGRLGGNPVRGSVTGDVVSGPVSDVSAGAVSAGRPDRDDASVGQSSVGAVTKDVGSPLGERIAEPLRDLGPLQDSLRALRPLPRIEPLAEDEGEAAEPAEQANSAVDAAEPAAAEPDVDETVAEVEAVERPSDVADTASSSAPDPDLGLAAVQPDGGLEQQPTPAEVR